MRAPVCRTRSRDYAFLGAAPPRQWWRSYADVADFEYPTLLVESDAQGWRAYASGQPFAAFRMSGRTAAASADTVREVRWDEPCARLSKPPHDTGSA
ncbi:hypothetical protein GCM10020000_04350 [Streptomyces olivoverticillatus]